MATNNTIPIWTSRIAPDAENEARGDLRGDAQGVVPAALVLRKSVGVMRALKVRDPEQERQCRYAGHDANISR